MARWHRFERGVQPVATMVQVIPLVAYAPAFVIWLGPGTRPIVAVATLIAVVPLLFNLVAGLRGADPDAREVLLSAGASGWELFRFLDLPSALPALFAGLRIAVGLTLIGAVLGEGPRSSRTVSACRSAVARPSPRPTSSGRRHSCSAPSAGSASSP